MSDSPLDTDLRQAIDGDRAAFGRVVAREADRVWQFARSFCGDDHLADDLAQETFVEAWRSLSRFDGRCRFSTWLFGILRHRYLKSTRKRQIGTVEADLSAARQEPGWPDSAERSAERTAERTEDAQQLRQAIAVLPPEHQAVIELRFFADASLDEIAAVLDIPLGTVKSRLHHALEKLRSAKLSVHRL